VVLVLLKHCTVGANTDSRQDPHPSTHNDTGQAQNRDRTEVSLFNVSVCDDCFFHATYTFNSCALPKRCISLASSLVPLKPSREASLSATCVSRAPSFLDMMSDAWTTIQEKREGRVSQLTKTLASQREEDEKGCVTDARL
jgi:hypothetical protein